MTYFKLLFFLIISTQTLLSQTADDYFKLAQKAYPDYKKAIHFLDKAVFKDIENVNYQFIRAKVKLLSRDNLLISQASKELKKIEKKDPFIACWSYYADLCKSGKINNISPDLIPVENNSILSFYVESDINTFVFYNRHNKGRHIEILFENFDKDIYDFPSLITCFKIKYQYSKWDKYKQKIIDAITNYPVEKLVTEVDVFSPNSLPLSKTPNQHNMTQSGSFMGSTSNFLNDFEIVKGISKRPKFAREILRFEECRKRLSLPSYEALNVAYPNFLHSNLFFENFYKAGFYKDIIELSKGFPFNNKESLNSKVYYGYALYERGQYAQAANILSSCLGAVKTDNLTPAFYLIRSLVKAGKADKAFEIAQKMNFSKINHEAQKKLFLSEYYYSIKNFQGYLKLKSQIKNYFTLTNNYHFLSANYSINLHNNEEARSFNHNELKLNKNIDKFLVSLVNNLLYEQDPKAQEIINYAKKIEPDNPHILLVEAKSMVIKNDLEEASKSVEKILTNSASYAKAIQLKGMILLLQNEFKSAYKTFSTLSNQETATYLKLLPLFYLGKLDLAEQTLKKLAINNSNNSVPVLLHMLWEKSDKDAADKFLTANLAKMHMYPAKCYTEYKLGKISYDEYKKKQDFGPFFGLKFNFAIGFEAMNKGDKEKAIEHFNKCLIPFSIDQPEYHMAKACLKMLEK